MLARYMRTESLSHNYYSQTLVCHEDLFAGADAGCNGAAEEAGQGGV